MGKSPGRWIKTVLFGKKSSKSNISKGREKLVNKKETVVASNLSENGLALDPSPNQIVRNEEDIELENREAENLLPGNQEINTVESVDQDATPDPEKIRLEEAATKAQAAFRGYLARRAFRALKGIIRLQALIRGHLVRRQAVATLCSMYAIVKLQAFVRGRRARQTDVGFEIQEKCALFKPLDGKLGEPVGISTKISQLSVNTFIRKLFAPSTTTMALHLQYVGGDPNSVSSWLERWSASNFWKPIPRPKKTRDSKSSRKQGNIAVGEAQISKSRRTRKLPTANFESVTVQANPESEKPKRNIRKISSQPSDPAQENPQSELEKVKRNLRKIHNPVVENAVLPEVESETPKQHLEKTTVTAGQAVLEQGVITSKEKIKKEAVSEQVVISSKEKMKKEAVSEQGIITSNEKIKTEAVSEQGIITSNEKIKNEAISEDGVITSHEKMKNKELLTISTAPVVEITPRPSVKKEQFDIPSGYQVTMESEPLTETTTKDNYTSADEAKNEQGDLPETIYKDENAPLTNGDLNHKEDKKGNENQKPTRKSSILAKQDRAESGLQSSLTLPSYMAATESAKAKLRTQGSPRFGQDGSERNSPAGRHSLPSSTNSKISSHSPRTQRSVQAGGKAAPKSDKSMPSSKGGDGKVIQAEWRR